jgi:hypothetical protein
MKKDEMGAPCGTNGRQEVAYRDLVGIPESKSHVGDPGVDGRILLKWILRSCMGAWTR